MASQVVDVAEVGGKLHAGCFKCMACATSLVGGAFKVQARQPYCTRAKQRATDGYEIKSGSIFYDILS